jgi:uncharacterized membrane protein
MNDNFDKPAQPHKTSLLSKVRTYFFTGVVIIAPVVITIWGTLWLFTLFDSWVKPLIPAAYNPDSYLPFELPGTGLVFALLFITVAGALGANLVGRTLLGWWDRIVQRTPVARSIYKGSKQIFQTLFSEKGTSFKSVCRIRWPQDGMYTIAFISREIDGAQIGLEKNRKMFAVYVATTPNPTGGYVVFVDDKDVEILDMSVEDGLKLVISMGLVFPDPPMISGTSGKNTKKGK